MRVGVRVTTRAHHVSVSSCVSCVADDGGGGTTSGSSADLAVCVAAIWPALLDISRCLGKVTVVQSACLDVLQCMILELSELLGASRLRHGCCYVYASHSTPHERCFNVAYTCRTVGGVRHCGVRRVCHSGDATGPVCQGAVVACACIVC
jgi:hypothetical protein